MSEENAEIVRRALTTAFQRPKPDFATVNALYHPDHELVSGISDVEGRSFPGARGPAGVGDGAGERKVRGLAAMGQVWRENLEGWGDLRVGEIDRIVENEDRVIVFNRLQGRGQRSGAVVEQPDRAAIFTFRDGRIVGLRLTNRAGGLEAAGLSE